MRRNEVTIDGIKLTRAQLEEGLRKINTPEAAKPGDVILFRGTDTRYKVIDPTTLAACACAFKEPNANRILLLDLSSNRLSYSIAYNFTIVSE